MILILILYSGCTNKTELYVTEVKRSGIDMVVMEDESKVTYLKSLNNSERFCASRESDSVKTSQEGFALGESIIGQEEKMEFIKPGINIDFIGRKKIGFALSLTLIVLSIASLIIHHGPNYGIDFVGGTLIQVKFSKPVQVGKIRNGLNNVGFKDASVQNFGQTNGHEFLIRTDNSAMSSKGLARSVKEALKTSTGIEPEISMEGIDMSRFNYANKTLLNYG